MAQFINLTPHPISIADQDGNIVRTIEPFGVVSRRFGEPEGIPEPEDGVIYIVSALVVSATDRDDVVAPDTGNTAVRDDQGRIVAVRRFVR